MAIEADVIAHTAAPKLVTRNTKRFAKNVPQREIDARDGRAAHNAVSVPEVLAIHHLPKVFDAGRILADEELRQVFHRAHDRSRVPFQRGLAPAEKPRLVSFDFDENPIPHARMANEGADRGDFHRGQEVWPTLVDLSMAANPCEMRSQGRIYLFFAWSFTGNAFPWNMPIARSLGRLGGLLLLTMLASATLTARADSAGSVIGLFTDYGWDDPYVAQMKGAIITIAPHAQMLDLIHSVTPFSVTEGSYLLDQSSEEFPSGTIFVAVVDPQVGTERNPILLETGKGKFYIGRDNGLFTRVIDREGFVRAWTLDKPEYFRAGAVSHTFHGRDIFGPIAAHLAAGVDPDKLGTPLKTISMLPAKDPSYSGETISAEVQHIDRFGNIILNLRDEGDVAAKLKEGNLVKILAGRESFSGPLVKTYGEVAKGRLLLLYGSSGNLEISVNQGSAAQKLKAEPGMAIFLKP